MLLCRDAGKDQEQDLRGVVRTAEGRRRGERTEADLHAVGNLDYASAVSVEQGRQRGGTNLGKENSVRYGLTLRSGLPALLVKWDRLCDTVRCFTLAWVVLVGPMDNLGLLGNLA